MIVNDGKHTKSGIDYIRQNLIRSGSVIGYWLKAIKASGVDPNPEMLAGLSMPLVLFLS